MPNTTISTTLPDGRIVIVNIESTGVAVSLFCMIDGETKLGEALIESFEGRAAVHVYKGNSEEVSQTVKFN